MEDTATGTATVPYFWGFVAAAVAALLLELIVLRATTRRLRVQKELGRRAAEGGWEGLAAPTIPARTLELLAALAPLIVAGILVAAVQEARATIMRAPTAEVDPSDKAAMLARGFSGTIKAVAYGAPPVMVLLVLGAVATSLAVATRLRARGLAHAVALGSTAPDEAAAWARHPGAEPGALVATVLAFLGLGLGPILRAALLGVAARVELFAAIVNVDPRLKAQLFTQHLDQAAAQMNQGLALSRIGLVAATIIAVALTIARSPGRARARSLGRAAEAPGNGAVVLGIVFLVLAGAAFATTRRFQRENDLPWPPADLERRRVTVESETPALEGPDEVANGPELVVSPAGLLLNNQPTELATLGQTLGSLNSAYRMMHPGQPFEGVILVACTPDTTGARLHAVLYQALLGGFDRPTLLFTRHQITDRPLLGPRRRTLATGAAFELVTTANMAEAGSTILDGHELTTCSDLGARLVELRRQDRKIAMELSR